MAYRKRKNSDTWHFCRNCTNWPTAAESVEQQNKPTSGEFCDQCLSKRKDGNCTS